jgi:hypothetical protein
MYTYVTRTYTHGQMQSERRVVITLHEECLELGFARHLSRHLRVDNFPSFV